MVRKTSESYEDTLSRLDIPLEETEEAERFSMYLLEELGITNVAFIESLWTAQQQKTSIEEHGIRGVPVTYPWGVQVRYAIQGLGFLWGWATVQKIREAEEW